MEQRAAATGPPVCRTAVAVCGCGHDGRLGIGSGAPSTLHEITLLEDFLTSTSSLPTSDTHAPLPGTVLQVACGAYHTLVLTTTGLFGWGLHEDGQLGLGRPSATATAPANVAAAACSMPLGSDEASEGGKKAVVPLSFDRPTFIPFARLVGEQEGEEENKGERSVDAHDTANGGVACGIVSLHCGADHSAVRTTHALYVTGRNDCGQLGLGHTEAVYTWTRLCATAAPLSARPCPLLPAAGYAAGDIVLRGRVTHVSCGTHHTLLALADALVLKAAAAGGSESRHQLRFYPAIVLACGRGDFGELGYDGDAWSILQAKAQRQERALRAEAEAQHKRGLAGDAAASQEDGSVTGGGPTAYKFKWKAAAAARQRRPPFSSPYFLPVGVEELTRAAVAMPADVADEVYAVSSCGSNDLLEMSPALLSTMTAFVEAHDASPAAEAENCGESGELWEVLALQAMHHHSSLTLQQVNKKPSDSICPPLLLHWGCYYCSEIEDAAASVPRAVHDAADDTSHRDASGLRWRLHAGDEILFRYPSLPSRHGAASGAAALQVIGTGNLGRGEESDEARTWTSLPLPCFPASTASVSAAGAAPTANAAASPVPLCVSAVTGRTHFLLSLTTPDNAVSPTCVAGFGDDLHGQLGRPCVAHAGNDNDDGDDDVSAVVRPRPVLQLGDTLRTAAVVRATLRDAAAPPHSRSAAVEATAAERSHWVVTKIRDVGAGARHSVFVVDVVVSVNASEQHRLAGEV